MISSVGFLGLAGTGSGVFFVAGLLSGALLFSAGFISLFF